MKIPSKDSIIQGLVAAAKIFGVIAGLASYNNYIPAQYLPIATFVVLLASTFKEGTTTILAFIRGDKITLAPPAVSKPPPPPQA